MSIGVGTSQTMSAPKAAPRDWQSAVTRTMWDLGFTQARASPCVIWNRQRDCKALVHGDDFVSCDKTELEWLCRSLQKRFETKMAMVGDDDLAKEDRIVRWHPRKGTQARRNNRLWYWSRESHGTGRETEEEKRQYLNVRRFIGKLESKTDNDDKEDALSADEVARYRRIAARA